MSSRGRAIISARLRNTGDVAGADVTRTRKTRRARRKLTPTTCANSSSAGRRSRARTCAELINATGSRLAGELIGRDYITWYVASISLGASIGVADAFAANSVAIDDTRVRGTALHDNTFLTAAAKRMYGGEMIVSGERAISQIRRTLSVPFSSASFYREFSVTRNTAPMCP